MRTTLDLPEKLLAEAMKTTGQPTKTSAIIFALESVIRREKLQKIKDYRGKLKLAIDLDTLRGR